MKITDILIESNNIQIETLSAQEANMVSGGSDVKHAMSLLVKQEKIKNAISSAVKARSTVIKHLGAPGEGGEPDPSCPYW